jgi:hypothetical protein
VSSYDPDEVHSPARISEGINTGNNNNSFFNTFRRRTENFMVNFERKYMNPLFGGPVSTLHFNRLFFSDPNYYYHVLVGSVSLGG